MTFKVIVTYQIHDGTVKMKEMAGVEKVERTWEKIGNDNVEVVRVHENKWQYRTWASNAILNINMMVER